MDIQNLGELFAALAMARQEFGTLTKGKSATIKSDKGSYGYAYADLSDVIEATAAALAKHGLVVIQEPEVVSDGGRQLVVVNGCIAHKSGAIYQLRPLPLPVVGGTAQAIGSAISYGRRYQLSAALNLAAADDDGSEASNGTDAPRNSSSATKTTLKTQAGASAPKRAVDASTGEILEPATNGNGAHADNPFVEVGAPADEELEVLGRWALPEDAYIWAVENKACKAKAHAKNSFASVIDKQFGGKFTTKNAAAVYLAVLRHWNETIAQPPEVQAQPEPAVA